MLENINAYIKYLYYILGIILIVLLVQLIIKLIKVSKSFNVDLKGFNDISGKINAIKQKCDYLKQSFNTSWAFFIEIFAIIQIIKITLFDYKDTPKAKRSMVKSAAKTIAHRPGSIAKIKKVL